MGGLGVAGVLLAPLYVWRFGFGLLELGLFVVSYWMTMGVGLCMGYHRHFTHGSFQASRPLRALMLICGSMAGQGPMTYWVAVHRRHHEHSDEPGDPYITEENRRRGQLAWLLRAQTLCDIDCWTRVLGEPMRPGAILDAIRDRIQGGVS